MVADTIHTVIQHALFFVPAQALMRDVVQDMRQRMISSVLVIDQQDAVVGIVTERDIVHKFTLLDIESKLDATVNTLMSRPVRFVRASHLFDDMRQLHHQYGQRHFPVLSSPEPLKSHVIGMVTATDLFRSFLKLEEERRRGHDPIMPNVVNISRQSRDAEAISHMLQAMGIVVKNDPHWHQHSTEGKATDILLYDLDHHDTDTNAAIVKELKLAPSPAILLTADARLVVPFRKHLGEGKYIFLKPVDVSYIHWLVTHKLATSTAP